MSRLGSSMEIPYCMLIKYGQTYIYFDIMNLLKFQKKVLGSLDCFKWRMILHFSKLIPLKLKHVRNDNPSSHFSLWGRILELPSCSLDHALCSNELFKFFFVSVYRKVILSVIYILINLPVKSEHCSLAPVLG